MLKRVEISAEMFAKMRALEKFKPRLPAEGIVATQLDLGGVRAEAMRPAHLELPELTIMYFHGGGFFSGSIDSHRALCERLAMRAEATVVSVAYRHLPEVSVAGSVDDALRAYTALLRLTDNVVVAGDSAGGYLAAKIVELAARRGLTAPRGLIGFSPLLSLDPDSQARSAARSVPMRESLLPEGRIAEMRSLWLADDVGIEGFATVLHAHEFIECPVHLVAVDDEFLCADVETFAARLAARAVPVELHLWGGLIHAFPSFLDFIPEGRVAVDHAARFAAQCGLRVRV